MALPALAFWVSLLVWANDHRPGENYLPMLLTLGLLVLSTMSFLIFVVMGLVMKIKQKDGFDWFIAALINLTPALGWLVFLMSIV